MSIQTIVGCILVLIAGLIMGGGVWPYKLMKRYSYEHWMFVAMSAGLVIIPWTIIYLNCPDVLSIYRKLWANNPSELIRSNLLAIGWGVANVTAALCYAHIGVALTGAILTGVGVTFGVLTPLLLKSSGMGDFGNAPDLLSATGIWILAGVAVMLSGVVFAAVAGLGRDRVLKKLSRPDAGHFVKGLVMAVAAGALSAGLPLAFVYSNGPVVKAMQAAGASNFVSSLAVWPIGALGGVLVNIIYPACLLTKNRSWGTLYSGWREFILAALIGANMIISMSLQGYGMRMIGILGASVGIGIQQASQIMGGQALGFISGEWRGIHGKPRMLMYLAIALLIVAAIVMTYGNHT